MVCNIRMNRLMIFYDFILLTTTVFNGKLRSKYLHEPERDEAYICISSNDWRAIDVLSNQKLNRCGNANFSVDGGCDATDTCCFPIKYYISLMCRIACPLIRNVRMSPTKKIVFERRNNPFHFPLFSSVCCELKSRTIYGLFCVHNNNFRI